MTLQRPQRFSTQNSPDDVIDQAVLDLNHGAAVLDAAPTADLSAKQADDLANQVTLSSQLDSALDHLRTAQDGLSAADQTFLGDADEQLVSASQNILSADQAFVAADQAGDLSGSGGGRADNDTPATGLACGAVVGVEAAHRGTPVVLGAESLRALKRH